MPKKPPKGKSKLNSAQNVSNGDRNQDLLAFTLMPCWLSQVDIWLSIRNFESFGKSWKWSKAIYRVWCKKARSQFSFTEQAMLVFLWSFLVLPFCKQTAGPDTWAVPLTSLNFELLHLLGRCYTPLYPVQLMYLHNFHLLYPIYTLFSCHTPSFPCSIHLLYPLIPL